MAQPIKVLYPNQEVRDIFEKYKIFKINIPTYWALIKRLKNSNSEQKKKEAIALREFGVQNFK